MWNWLLVIIDRSGTMPRNMKDNGKIDIVYQGIPGSYSEASLREFAALYNINANPVEERGFFEGLFDSIVNKTGLGWVPVSNSHAGTVHQAIDMFLEHDVEILAEYYFDVNHCLAVTPGTTLDQVKTAYSHPQALAQCSDYLIENRIATLTFHDTAAAAEMVAEKGDNEKAAICSEQAAETYGLEIIARNIQNDSDNVTRFLLVKRRDDHYDFEERLMTNGDTEYKTTAIFSAMEEAGYLHRCISGFAGAKINMSKIESRRLNHGPYNYLFYLDYDRKLDDPGSQGALTVLKQHAELVRVLGSYPRYIKNKDIGLKDAPYAN